MRKYIGVDLGGTSVRVSLVDEEGNILIDSKSPSYAKEGVSKVLDNICSMIDKIIEKEEVLGIGMGVPGPVVDGVMQISTNLVGFKDYPLKKVMEEKYKLPVFVDNDANVAGICEAILGAGKGKNIVYYITHSTGIGGALIIDKKLIVGKNGYAGEIGNIIVDKNKESLNGLNKGAVESLASGPALARKLNSKNAQEVFDLARKNDPVAINAIDEMVEDFSVMMSSIAHVIDPDCFVIGGGCSNADDVYFEKLITELKAKTHLGMHNVEVLKAKYDNPGVIGAAMLCVSNGII